MAKPNLDKFIELVEQSGLVQRDPLHRVVERFEQEVEREPTTEPELLGRKLVEDGLITPWQCDKLLEGRHKGFFLKRYKLLGHLGTGGMSTVYLAEHVLMQRRVAIKVLPKNRVEDASYLKRFHRESRAAASLDHRNIVRAYDVDNEGDVHFLVMEYVDGRDLQRIVREEGPLECATAANYIHQAALGLAHAHHAGLIHRDVKPANMLVDLKRVVKVLDLGLARFTGEDQASLTVAHDENVLGTADYLAPEQARDSHGVDARADIYSLGCSLYYLLTGQPPFAKGTLPQRLMMHQKSPPPSIQQIRAEVPSDLIRICLRMMAKNPKNRYPSAKAVAEAMAEWLVNHGHSSGSKTGSSSSRLVIAVKESGSETLPQAQKIKSAGPAKSTTPGNTARAAGKKTASRGKPSVAAKPKPKQANPAVESETLAGQGDSTTAPSNASLKGLPQAKPLESDPAASEFTIRTELPVARHLKTARLLTDEEYEAYLANRKKTPVWVWVAIAGASVLVVGIWLLKLIFGV